MLKNWQRISLWKRVLLGMIVGLVLGLSIRLLAGPELASEIATWLEPFGTAFVRLITMLVFPLIITTLIVGVTTMGDPKRLGSLGIKAITLYFLTTIFAVSLGLAIGTVVKPGAGASYQSASQNDIDKVTDKIGIASEKSASVSEKLLEIIPKNPADALANGQVLPVIFFSIIIGIGILVTGKKAEPVKTFFEAAAEVVMRVTIMVMELAPFGAMFLMAWVMADRGFGVKK